MHTIIHPSQWRKRIEPLGLTLKDVARQAGLSHSTLYRGLAQAEPNFEQSTIEAVSAVIVEVEARLAQHLVEVRQGSAP